MAITTPSITVRPSTRTASATARMGPSSRVRYQSGTDETIDAPATTTVAAACQGRRGATGQERPDHQQQRRRRPA